MVLARIHTISVVHWYQLNCRLVHLQIINSPYAYLKQVSIIQKLDRRMTLEDIAGSQQCSVEELLDAIEGIVASGTKVGLDYVLEEYLDEDSIEELWDCFMDSEQGSVAEVMEEMEDAYSEEEIRLVRIKFMSEVAN